MLTHDFGAERQLPASACRVLAARQPAPGFLGHVCRRAGSDRMLIRCRRPQERGLAWTTADDVRLVALDGKPSPGASSDGWEPPNELPPQAEVLRARQEVASVVHAGASVQEAALQAISVDTIARTSLAVRAAGGGELHELPGADLDSLPDLGPAFGEGVAWRHDMVRLSQATGDAA